MQEWVADLVNFPMVDAILALTDYNKHGALQSAYLLLRYCAEPCIAHLLRAAWLSLVASVAQVHDAAILWDFSVIVSGGD